MDSQSLTMAQRTGVKASISVVMLVLILFGLILVAGHPIRGFGTEPHSVAYALGIYTPVLALCVLAYRRLR